MFLDNNSMRSCSPSKKNVKRLKYSKKDDETWESIALHYFLVSVFVFCGHGLYFWNLFEFCGLILCFFECVSCWRCFFPFGDLCFCFLVVVFCFGSPFCLCVSVLGLFFSIFVVVVVVVLWFFCFYQPPYIFDSPLHLNPTTGEHFKTPLKISSQISNRPGKK